MNLKGKLYLIPNTLGSEETIDVIPAGTGNRLNNVSVIFVEHPKEARRLLIGIGLKDRLNEIELVSVLNGINAEDRKLATDTLNAGKDIGFISDAGCPAIADPGNEFVKLAHTIQAKVVPLTGPSSILLALMASGFNGQNFAFHGYLPKDQPDRKKKIRDLENEMIKKSQTQIFIETPYRNQHLFNDLLSECQKKTKICLALNLSLPEEQIKVDSIENWLKNKINIEKQLCIFLMYK